MSTRIYLAGPVTGLPASQWKIWRSTARNEITKLGMVTIDPMRDWENKGYLKDTGYWFGRNRMELESADAMLIGTGARREIKEPKSGKGKVIPLRDDTALPTDPDEEAQDVIQDVTCHNGVSLGTSIEIGIAHTLGKPIFCVQRARFLVEHPLCKVLIMPPARDLKEAAQQIENYFGLVSMEEA